jgi:chromosomal replication initiation ATPase DnaA
MEHNGSSRETYGRYRRIEIGIAQALVAYAFGVPLKELCAPCRGDAYTAFVRHVAMYLTHVTFGLTLDEVGFGFAATAARPPTPATRSKTCVTTPAWTGA